MTGELGKGRKKNENPERRIKGGGEVSCVPPLAERKKSSIGRG